VKGSRSASPRRWGLRFSGSSLLEIPAGIAAGVVLSVFGDGAAVRATTFVWFLWAAYLGVLLIRKAEGSRVRTAV
jgi:hypothetical protein